MQKLLNPCSKYVVDHSLTYNAKKFITVEISTRPQLYLDTPVIPRVSDCKYLGIIVCQKNYDVILKETHWGTHFIFSWNKFMQMLTCYSDELVNVQYL